MDPYSLLLWLGFAGLVIMAVLGAAGGHGGHSHGHGNDAHGFHLPGGHHNGGSHGTALHGHATHHHTSATPPSHGASHSHSSSAAHHSHAPSVGSRLLNWVSPRTLFAVALGSGATGIIAAPYLANAAWHAACALLGGIGLEKGVVAPLWNVLLRFSSTPARTLETAVFEEATALTGFDESGCGLVSIDLDGHEMRALGRLKAEQRGQSVRAGDRLLVEEVNATNGQCRVAKIENLAS